MILRRLFLFIKSCLEVRILSFGRMSGAVLSLQAYESGRFVVYSHRRHAPVATNA